MAFGKIIENLKINGKHVDYPVLNDRDARAAAGIMFVVAIFAFVTDLFQVTRLVINITVILFTIEFLIRVFDPHFAPFYALGRLIVSNQKPDWVGAIQKRFAWSLGLLMATSMIVLSMIYGVRGAIPFTICGICLTLLFFEISFGICIGCKLYYGLMNVGVIKKPQSMPACPGGVCEIPAEHVKKKESKKKN